jgi:glycine/D-amino acid oxidase-like deaminating enzyme
MLMIFGRGEAGAPLPPGTALVKTLQPSIDRLLSSCKLISPLLDIEDAEIVTTNLCYRPVSNRGYPYVCKLPQRPNLFLLAGHGPWGISLSTGSALAMSELILDGYAKSADVQYLSL